MITRIQIQRIAGSLVVSIVLGAALAACGSTTAASAPPPAPTSAPAVKPAAPPAEAPPNAAADQPVSNLATQGRILFEETKGCAACHGPDARGTESIGAPNIQGKTEPQIRTALAGVQMMSHLKLTSDELKAIVAHLKKLSDEDH
jgi:mono/diheme cytochrome c family protein